MKCGSISLEEGRGIIKGGRETEKVGGKEGGREENDSPLFVFLLRATDMSSRF